VWQIPLSVNISGLPGAARQLVTFLASPRKVTQRRRSPIRHPFGIPCVARLVRRLWNSHCVLRQSSPTTPDQPPLLGGVKGEDKAKIKTKFESRIKNKYKIHLWALCAHTVFAVDLLTPVHSLNFLPTSGVVRRGLSEHVAAQQIVRVPQPRLLVKN